MKLRDELEYVLRSWNALEVSHGGTPVIDYDCYPQDDPVAPAEDRATVHQQLEDIRARTVRGNERHLLPRIDADLAYLRALMGEHKRFAQYISATQGCSALGWPSEYVESVGNRLRERLRASGITWGETTEEQLDAAEGPIASDAAPEAIKKAASEYEDLVRAATGSDASFDLAIEPVETDEYWSYWLDGGGNRVRLRINTRRAKFTEVRARQFALHELLGHGLQYTSLAARCANEDVPWVRLLSVHAPHQVLFEGLAQALPLLLQLRDDALTTRVYFDHYLELVRSELHIFVNSGVSIRTCIEHARSRVPFWTGAEISNVLADRGLNPLLRSYLWAYPAGVEWFIALAKADAQTRRRVLREAYRAPLTPSELSQLWSAGPLIGGPGGPRRQRAK